MPKLLDERAVLRTAQLGLVLAFTSNLVSGAALLVAARSLKLNEEYAFVAREAPARHGAADGDERVASRGLVPSKTTVAPSTSEVEAAPVEPPAPETPAPNVPGGALTPEQLAIIAAAPEDPAPEELGGMRNEVYGRHYFASDEWNPQLFYGSVRDKGGAYIGVGTDQAYLFGAWARSEMIWAVDYDPMVSDVHRVYRDFFSEAETPEELVALWSKAKKKEALALLYRLHPDADERRPYRVAYLRARLRVSRRLLLLRKKLRGAGVPSFLTDQEQYDYVRSMFAAGRVRPMRVDLTASQGMVGIAEASRRMGVPVRVMYLSNAEQYWKYSPQFRENIKAFDFEDSALVLRTISSRKANGDYRYNVHVAKDFQRQLGDKSIRQVYQFVDLRRLKGGADIAFSVTGEHEPRARELGPGATVPASGAGQD